MNLGADQVGLTSLLAWLVPPSISTGEELISLVDLRRPLVAAVAVVSAEGNHCLATVAALPSYREVSKAVQPVTTIRYLEQ